MNVRDLFPWLMAAGLLFGPPQTFAQAEYVVVANEHAGTLTIIDRAANDAARSLDVGGDPHNLAVTPDRRVLVTHPSAGLVSVVDPRQPAVLKRFSLTGKPHGVAVGPDGRWAYVGAESERSIHVLNLQTLRMDRVCEIEPAPHNLVVTATKQAWITVLGGRFLWIVDLHNGTVVHRLETSASPHDLALDGRGNAAWVANWGSKDVFYVHGEPPRVEAVKISGQQPHHVAVSPDGGEVWITNHASEDVSVIDSSGRREIARIAVGAAPHHVTFSGDGRQAFVANSGSDDVSVIDVKAKREIGRLTAGAHPHGIVTVPHRR